MAVAATTGGGHVWGVYSMSGIVFASVVEGRESMLELLATRDGDYNLACGLDFGHFGAYNMWVLRDRVGRLTAGIWPYFLDATSM